MPFDQLYFVAVEQLKAMIIKNINTVMIFIGITVKISVQLTHILIQPVILNALSTLQPERMNQLL